MSAASPPRDSHRRWAMCTASRIPGPVSTTRITAQGPSRSSRADEEMREPVEAGVMATVRQIETELDEDGHHAPQTVSYTHLTLPTIPPCQGSGDP